MDIKRLIIVAVGGQGNMLASGILANAALLAGIPVRMSEIHGMAQRGGVVESSIIFGNAKSTTISDGEADLLLGFEPSETLRALNRCNSETIVISSTSPLPPFTVTIGKGVYPDLSEIKKKISERAKQLIMVDALELAKQAGNTLAVNIVLIGTLIKTNVLPLHPEHIKEVIRTKTKASFVESNMKAFDLGFSV